MKTNIIGLIFFGIFFSSVLLGQKISASSKKEFLRNENVIVPYAMRLGTVTVNSLFTFGNGRDYSVFVDMNAEYFFFDKFSTGLHLSLNDLSTAVGASSTVYAYDTFGFLPDFLSPYINANIAVGFKHRSSDFIFIKYGVTAGANIMFVQFGGLRTDIGFYAENDRLSFSAKFGAFLIF